MPDVVFWDTAAFIALGSRDDRLHAAAVATNNELARHKTDVLTTDAVLIEVANAFSRSTLRPIAFQIMDAVQRSARLGVAQIVHVDESLWQRGWDLFKERPDKDWSMTTVSASW